MHRLDLGALLVEHPQATFLLRVAGPSMRELGIDDGDLVVVDRALQARHGQIVVAVIEGEFTIKKLFRTAGMVRLRAGNRGCKPEPPKIPSADMTINRQAA